MLSKCLSQESWSGLKTKAAKRHVEAEGAPLLLVMMSKVGVDKWTVRSIVLVVSGSEALLAKAFLRPRLAWQGCPSALFHAASMAACVAACWPYTLCIGDNLSPLDYGYIKQ